MTTSESKGRFFLQNESIRIDSHNESIRIANWNALIDTRYSSEYTSEKSSHSSNNIHEGSPCEY